MQNKLENQIRITQLKLLSIFILSNFLIFYRNALEVNVYICLFILIVMAIKKLLFPFFQWIRGLFFVFLLTILIQSFTFQGFGFRIEGMIIGLLTSLRILTLSSIVFYFLQTTPLRLLAKSLFFLPKSFQFILTLSMGMVPTLIEEFQHISIAQQTRGHKKSWNIIYTYVPILLPFFTRSIIRSEKLAIALQTRGANI